MVNFAGEFVRLGQNSPLLIERVTPTQLAVYARLFADMLGSVYRNLRDVNSGLVDGLAFQAFSFGEKSTLTESRIIQ